MEVELKKKSKKGKKLVIGILLVLIVTIGISYGLFKYSKVSDNQQLIAGDIYMKAISNEITSGNIRPMDTEEGKTNGNKYKFKVEGYNNSKKDIYYGIYLKYGEEQTGKERFKDEDIMIYLTETKDGVTKDVFGPGRLSDFNRNLIYANTIEGNISKEDKVDIDYELTVWLNDNILISDTETEWEGKTIYTSDEFANSYFSLDVEVEGDFVEKNLTSGETSITAIKVDSLSEYDLKESPLSDEDIKVTISTNKPASKIVVTNITTNEKQELVPNKVGDNYQVEITYDKYTKASYYVIYTDSKISDTYYYTVNINPERYTLIEKPTEAICIARTYNGESQDLVENNKEGYTLDNYKQKDAGSYQIKAILKENYRWSDKSQEDITINCSIGKKDLIVTPDSNQSKVYGTDDKDLTYTYTGNLEEPGFTGKLGRAEGNDVGTYLINKGTLDIEDKLPFKASNYNLKFSETPVNFEIIKATPKLTLSSETGEVLEGKSVTITGTITPNTAGTYTVTTSKEGIVTTKVSGNEITITGVSNGSVDVVVTFNPTDTKNYNKSNSVTYKVTGYKVASEATCANPTYNGTSQNLASGGIGITLGSNAGTDAKDNYSVTETLQEGYRWSDNTTGNKTLTCKINKKNASITANDQTVTYGTGITNAVSQATAKDLVTNHTLGAITLTASTKDVPGGKITPSNAKIMSGETEVTANYNLSYVDGTLTINKKQITVTPNSNLSKTYGDTDPTIGYSNTGAISGENPVFTGKLGRTIGENVGTYPVNLGNLTLSDGEGFKANNYSLTLASGTYNFTITQRETTITPVNQTITYGGSIDKSVSKATASNLVTGHSLSEITLTTTDTNVTSSGKISASGAKIVNGSTDVTSNYKISYGTGTLTINKADVEAGSCANKTYSGAEQTIVNTVSGVNYTTTKGTDAKTYTITATPDSNHKFSDNAANKTLSCSIGKKSVTLTWNVGTYTYNGSNQGPSATVASGAISGETLTISTTKQTNAGTNITSTATVSEVSGGRANKDNYTISNPTQTYTIAKATPTLTLSSSSGNVLVGSTILFTASAKFNNNDVAGTYTATSQNSGIATASVSDNTIAITGKGAGTTNITVGFNPTDTTNYNSATSQTYSVTSKIPTAVDKVLDKVKDKSCNPIVEDEDGTIYFSGNDECIDFNYVWYSGKLWRITAINPDGTMKMRMQDAITAIYWGENTTYKDSWIYQWLNEDFKDTLYNYQNIIVQNADWNATPDGNSIPAKPPTDKTATIVQGNVGLLNAYEYYQSYKNISGSSASKETYLKNGNNYSWFMTPYSSSMVWNVTSGDKLSNASPSSSAYGVRPVINLKSDIKLSGEGTKSNPYTITIDKPTGIPGDSINTRLSGEYVKVDNKIYRIVGIENGTTKLTGVDFVRDEYGSILTKQFSTSRTNESWVFSQWNTYLNDTWLTTELQNYITDGTYYLGAVKNASYKNSICSESNTTETTKNCEKTTKTWTGKVGLPRVGEMFSVTIGNSTFYSMSLITPADSGYTIRTGVGYYLERRKPNEMYDAVRPSINLKSEVKIAGGSGTIDSPYTVSLGTSSPSNEGPGIVDENIGTNKTASLGSCNNLIYNGEEQTLVSGGKNVTYSNNKGTDAGTYTVMATTKNGYFFNDGSTTKTLSCTIEKKTLEVNYSSTSVKYTGGLVAPKATAIGVNGEKIELETTKNKEVGNYTTVATMKDVNPNYTLRNTVIDYEITKDNVKEEASDIKTKVVINYYLMNKDGVNYTLVNSKEIDSKEGDSITGELNKYDGYITPKEITIKVVKGINIINYYYER